MIGRFVNRPYEHGDSPHQTVGIGYNHARRAVPWCRRLFSRVVVGADPYRLVWIIAILALRCHPRAKRRISQGAAWCRLPSYSVGERLARNPQNEQGGAYAPLQSEIYRLLFLYPKNLSEYRCDKMRRAKQYDLHCKNRPFRMLIALIMFSQKQHACGDKYGGFKKSQEIQRKYKRAKNARGKAHGTKPQKLTKSYMAHVYFPLADVFNRIICRSRQNDHEK